MNMSFIAGFFDYVQYWWLDTNTISQFVGASGCQYCVVMGEQTERDGLFVNGSNGHGIQITPISVSDIYIYKPCMHAFIILLTEPDGTQS